MKKAIGNELLAILIALVTLFIIVKDFLLGL